MVQQTSIKNCTANSGESLTVIGYSKKTFDSTLIRLKVEIKICGDLT